YVICFFFASRRRHTRFSRDWSSDVCSSDLLGELLGERGEPHGGEHRGGDGDDVAALAGDLDDLLGEDGGPAEARGGDGQAGLGVDDADGVEAVGDVLHGRGVAAALLGDRVDDDGAAEGLGAPQRELHGSEVVAVDRADVLHAQVLEHALGGDDVLD